MSWDYRGRLVSAVSGSGRAAYFYADTVERVCEEHAGSLTCSVGMDFELRDGVAVVYARVGDRRVARVNGSTLQVGLLGDMVSGDARGARIDVGDAWLATEPLRYLYASARRCLLEHSAATAFLHHDQLGSASLATGPAAERLGERAFQAVGDARERRGYVDAYGYTGQRPDPSSRLTHFSFREFDPNVGRWMSPDPLFLTDNQLCLERAFECANGYQYVLNDPIDRYDPTGEMFEAVAQWWRKRFALRRAPSFFRVEPGPDWTQNWPRAELPATARGNYLLFSRSRSIRGPLSGGLAFVPELRESAEGVGALPNSDSRESSNQVQPELADDGALLADPSHRPSSGLLPRLTTSTTDCSPRFGQSGSLGHRGAGNGLPE
ncbi:MAG: RHS repeat-associated core domain-containing protein [Myxococcales bacterium]